MASSTGQRPLRRDAAANRRLILAAAQKRISLDGIDAPLRVIAKDAGVSEATLYRHFPAHAALVSALYDDLVDALSAVVDTATRATTGWDAVSTFLSGACETMVRRPASASVMRARARLDPDYQPGAQWRAPLRAIVERAIAEGALRPDVTAADLVHVPLSFTALSGYAEHERRVIASRLLAVYVTGLRAAHASTPITADPIDASRLHEGMHGIA